MTVARKQAGRSRHRTAESRHETLWRTELPSEWAHLVEVPLDFELYREYEMPAQRVVGRDVSGEACFVHHQYLLSRVCSDGEECYEELDYYEEMHAWRLRDERWLIYRRVATGACTPATRGFYSFSPHMPRS